MNKINVKIEPYITDVGFAQVKEMSLVSIGLPDDFPFESIMGLTFDSYLMSGSIESGNVALIETLDGIIGVALSPEQLASVKSAMNANMISGYKLVAKYPNKVPTKNKPGLITFYG